MENTENDSTKVQISMRLDPIVFKAVSKLAVDEDRSLTNMVERLLKTTPQVQEILEAEAVAA